MSFPGRVKYVVIVVLSCILVAPAAVANAAPDGSLCKMNTARGAIPATFALQACVDTGGIQMRNQLDVPVRLSASGDTKPIIKLSTDIGGAAIVTRLLHPNTMLVLPGDHVRVPFGNGAAKVVLNTDDAAYRTYLFATTMLATVPGGKLLDSYEALAGLIKDWSDAFATYQTCLSGANWIRQMGCSTSLNWRVSLAFGKAVVLGLGGAILKTILSPLFYLQWLGNQVPSIGTIIRSERTISITVRSSGGSSGGGGSPGGGSYWEPHGGGSIGIGCPPITTFLSAISSSVWEATSAAFVRGPLCVRPDPPYPGTPEWFPPDSRWGAATLDVTVAVDIRTGRKNVVVRYHMIMFGTNQGWYVGFGQPWAAWRADEGPPTREACAVPPDHIQSYFGC